MNRISTEGWEAQDGWSIAPAGLPWISEGSRVTLGNGVKLGNEVVLGAGAVLGTNARDPVDLGWADGYRKCVAQVEGVAMVGAGCRWFTLADALEHWGNHKEDRSTTMCLMQSAIAIAKLKGWRLK